MLAINHDVDNYSEGLNGENGKSLSFVRESCPMMVRNKTNERFHSMNCARKRVRPQIAPTRVHL